MLKLGLVDPHVSSSSSMEPQRISGGEFRMVSTKDTQVQSLVEGCLQRYMNKKEVVEDLLRREKVEPLYTQIVLQKLEEQNKEFFKAYHVRLIVKQQIMIFNKLLEKQSALMYKHEVYPAGVSPLPVYNGSDSLALNQNLPCYGAEHAAFPLRPDHVGQSAGSSNGIINSGSTMPPNALATADTFVHSGRMDITGNKPLAWHLSSSMLQGSCGVPTFEPLLSGYLNVAALDADANVFNPNSTTFGDAPVASLRSTASNLPTMSESFNDHDICFLVQIPQIPSFSDLPTEFTSDAIGNYDEPGFQRTQIDNLQDSREGEVQENKLLHTTFCPGLSYDDLING